MDALAALGFAANIFQFVESVSHVLQIGNQLRRNGMSDGHTELERSASILQHQVDRIRIQCGTAASVDQAGKVLDRLAEECMDISKDIMDFTSWFKIDREKKPVLQQVPDERKLSDEELEYNRFVKIQKIHQELAKLKKINSEDLTGQELADLKRLDGDLNRLSTGDLKDARAKDESLRSLQQKDPKVRTLDENKKLKELRADSNRIKKNSFLMASVEARIKDLRPIVSHERLKFDNERQRIAAANKEVEEKAKARRSIKTLAKAIQQEWNKPKAKALEHKLGRIRVLLYSEVLLNIQKSVVDLQVTTNRNGERLEGMWSDSLDGQNESRDAMRENQLAVESVIRAQSEYFSQLDDAAKQRHEAVVGAIDSFTKMLQSQYLFPALPRILTSNDPSLAPAALFGYEMIEDAILTTLHFPVLEDRETQIRDAHLKTFSWIFEEPSSNAKPWSDFKQFLQHGHGCYWIGGKAGCGKSTLMKFLVSDERTRSALSAWYKPSKLVMASCFFWMAGSSLQKNEEGLLRSILHTILRQRRELISKAFPARYTAMTSKLFKDNSDPDVVFNCDVDGCRESFQRPHHLDDHRKSQHCDKTSSDTNDHTGSLTVLELRRALHLLSSQMLGDLKICLFIDGLDEYTGDQAELVEMFRTITKHPCLKAVLSSRPEPAFVEAFSRGPKLCIEDLTAGDIELYVRNKLLWHSLMGENFDLGERLLQQILSRAAGVWLWVYLVVRNLRQSLDDGSYPEELEAILETYPPELDDLYDAMLARMKPEYQLEAFLIFQGIFVARRIESKIPSALRFSYFARDRPVDSIRRPLNGISVAEIQKRLSAFEVRLRSRCCGMLEVQQDKSAGSKYQISRSEEGRVAFLHRTAIEFLTSRKFQEKLNRETQLLTPDINEKLMASILFRFKCRDYYRLKTTTQWQDYLHDIEAFLAYSTSLCSEQSRTQYLTEFNLCLEQLWQERNSEKNSSKQRSPSHFSDHHWAESFLRERNLKATSEPDDNPLLVVAARYGFSDYAGKFMRSMDSSKSIYFKCGGALLAYRLSQWAMQHASLKGRHLKILESLFSAGFDPNVRTSYQVSTLRQTPWEDLVYLGLKGHPISRQDLQPDPVLDRGVDNKKADDHALSLSEELERWAEVVQLYLKFGADPLHALECSEAEFEGRAAVDLVVDVLSMAESRNNSSSANLTRLQTAITNVIELTGNTSATHTPSVNPAYSSKVHKMLDKTSDDLGPGTGLMPAFSTTIDPGARRTAVDALTELGFGLDAISLAIEKAGVGYDTIGLAAWLSETSRPGRRGTTLTSPKLRPMCTNNASQRAAKRFDSNAQQWNVVAKAKKPQEAKQVVGAQYVSKPKRRSGRAKSETLKTIEGPSNHGTDESTSNAGALELLNGTFTWFFDPKACLPGPRGLSAVQQDQLRDLLASFFRENEGSRDLRLITSSKHT